MVTTLMITMGGLLLALLALFIHVALLNRRLTRQVHILNFEIGQALHQNRAAHDRLDYLEAKIARMKRKPRPRN